MKPFRPCHRILIVAALAAAAACSTKSPTEPGGSGVPIGPKVPPPVATFSITVTANPSHLTIGATTGSKITGCVFCDLPKEGDDAKVGIVHRGEHCYIILNSYPYTPGHVMVVPYEHLDELQKLPLAAAQEMMVMTQRMEGILRQLYVPDGINVGMNIGKAAGAGVAGHIHMHILPRWVADANFITVVGETRILPETLEMTFQRIKGAWGG